MSPTKNSSPLNDILFEIGCEELPATNLADIFSSSAPNMLEARVAKIFEDKRITFEKCTVWATPRRLVFYLEKVAPSQTPKDQMTKILAKTDAYDANGQATEKFLTILKHRNSSLEETVISDLNGKEFVFIKKAEEVQKTQKLLPEIFDSLVRTMGFPKNMKWDDSGIYFPRPIRNYSLFYGDKSISFKIGHTYAQNKTVVFFGSQRKSFTVKNIQNYFQILKKNNIILDPVERKTKIKTILDALSKSSGGSLYEDPFLLGEVNFLVENPNGILAPFGKDFLKLPLEVLTVSMARKQRIFGLVDSHAQVFPKFVAILDGNKTEKEKKLISKNIENILHAKLQDSLFFYQEDLKVSLATKREDLKNLVFLKGAGSMFEKSERLCTLAKRCEDFRLTLDPNTKNSLIQAAFLCKSDLLTQMVGEFPELQGIMGKYYALENGQTPSIANAIGEHYLPRTVQDALPRTLEGSVLSILDKSDLIVAAFGLGLEPTSSLDPYGLRRSATAILKIILDKKINLGLEKLLLQNMKELSAYIPKEKAESVFKKLDLFFKDRFKALLIDRGYADDLIEAAMASSFKVPYEVFGRIQELAKISKDESFIQTWKVVERTANILKGNKEELPTTINASLLQEEVEKQVFEKFESSKAGIDQAIQNQNHVLATRLYAEAFFAIVGQFFDKVFVNSQDLEVRKNRLALLKAVNGLYTKSVADLSRIRPL